MGKWKLMGLDTFSDEEYDIDGEWDNEAEAYAEGQRFLVEHERLNPTASSGGQSDDGIQDRFFVIRPDGTSYRILPGLN